MKIIHVVGARPNFMKVAPVIEAIERRSGTGASFEQKLVHTGQHYDPEMSQRFFDELGLPRPDINLGVGSDSHARQTAAIMTAFEETLITEKPDLVLVVGDVNSTMACAIVAKKLNVDVAHIEAGLRSHDMTMPEEVNRRITDAISDLFFVTETDAIENLRSEGAPENRIHFVGNVMIDTLLKHRQRALETSVLDDLGLRPGGAVTTPYALVTLHRPSNVGNRQVLGGICDALEKIAADLAVIFPCHPGTRARIAEFGLEGRFTDSTDAPEKIRLVPPLGYLEFLNLQANAKIVLTDSGGIQEETTILNVPCVTLRENTERPVTLTEGTNVLAGNRTDAVLAAFEGAMKNADPTRPAPRNWDGLAAERIVDVLATL